jgi:hypothetical protein
MRSTGVRVLIVSLLLIRFGLGVGAVEESDLKQVLEQMKKMEATIAEQQKTIVALQQAVQGKATAEEKVDKALAKNGSAEIFHDPALHGRKIRMGGYLDVSYQYSVNQPDNRMNNERVFDNEDVNDFNVHLAKLYFDGTAQEKGQAGFRVDLAFGTDARKIASYDRAQSGTYSVVDPAGAVIGSTTVNQTDRLFDLEQAYVDYIIPVGNGLRMKVGKFVTPHGFEVIESQENWNATRSFNFGKAIPFTHTGIGFEYQASSAWTVKGYLVNGWDNLQDNNEGKTGMLQSAWTPVKWLTWTVTGAVGNEKTKIPGLNNGDEADTRYLVNTTLLMTPWEKWSFGLEGNYGNEAHASLDLAEKPYTHVPTAEWWGAAAYLKFQFLKDWYLAGRGEYLNDFDASRTSFGALAGARQELYSGTVTLSYSPATSFETRLEYRHDASDKRAFAAKQYTDPALAVPNHGPLSWIDTQDTITVQFLYKF